MIRVDNMIADSLNYKMGLNAKVGKVFRLNKLTSLILLVVNVRKIAENFYFRILCKFCSTK